MCGCGSATSRPIAATTPPLATKGVESSAAGEQQASAAKTASSPAVDARVSEMLTRMAKVEGFEQKNKLFHEYFDAIPATDQASRTTFFSAFMQNIPKSDAERVIQFLKKLEAQSAPTTPAAEVTPTTQRATSSAPQGVLMIGDSLSVGTDPFFGDEQTGVPTTVNAKGGRSLSQGMDIYNATQSKPRVVQMALFTNNTPNQIDSLRAALDQTISDARARGGRVVWATIVGNPTFGNYDAVNSMFRDYAAKNADVMGLVDWEQMVKQNPSYLAGDKVHGTSAGYKARAEAFAQASKI